MERFLFILIYSVVAIAVNNTQLKRIKKAESVQEANQIRTFTAFFRAFWPIIGVITYICLFWYYLKDVAVDINVDLLLMMVIILIPFLSNSSKISSEPLPISNQTKDSYLSEYDDFILYLRAFHNDKYNDDNLSGLMTPSLFHESAPDDRYIFDCFNEQFFVDEMEQFLPSCAVGMSSEIESPRGASRIYVDNTSWHEDVFEIMGQATWIFVLLEDRESCLWEFEQSLTMREKTIYIVDDKEMYSRIKEKNPSLSLPGIPECYWGLQHFFFRWIEDKYVMLPFENTISDYRWLAKYLFGVQAESDKVEMENNLYSSLNRIWISDLDSPSMLKQRLNQRICELQQHCPITRDESTTLVGYELMDNQIVFKSTAKDITDPQMVQFYELSCQEEFNEEKDNAFIKMADCLHIDICHSYTDPSSGETIEFIINNNKKEKTT